MNNIDKLYQDINRSLPHLTNIYSKDGKELCDLFIRHSKELDNAYKHIFEFKIKQINKNLDDEEYNGISLYYIHLKEEMPVILSALKHMIKISFDFNLIKAETKEYLINKINEISY